MLRNFIYVLLFFQSLTNNNLWSQNRDTVLVKMESNPFFFNLLKSKSGEIYTGTSKGIFKISNQNLEKIDDRVGYIAFDQNRELIIDKDGLKNYVERRFLHLLPYPNQVREQYHASTDNYLFIVSNGFLYFFEIVPYKQTYTNTSIRTISRNFLGTYSGVFFKNQKMNSPTFSDGYIREYGNKAFICYHELIIRDITDEKNAFNEVSDVKMSFNSQVEDVFRSPSTKNHYLITIDKLVHLSRDFKSYNVLYKTKPGNMAFLGEMKGSLFFSANNQILTYSLSNNSIVTRYQHTETILSGYTSVRNVYFLTEKGFYIYNSDESVKKLTDLHLAHTAIAISNTEHIISTNAGLWYFNSNSKELAELIPGVEFNKKALFLEGDKISAGSIKGLYTFSINAIPELIKRNQGSNFYNSIAAYKIEISIAAFLIMGALVIMLREIIRGRKKIHYYEEKLEKQALEIETNESKISRKQIEDYINEKLAEASLKSITDHFGITTSQIYSILKPDKPGTIIQQLRKEKVLEMKKNKISTKEIAYVTGLSTSYIRKLNESTDIHNHETINE